VFYILLETILLGQDEYYVIYNYPIAFSTLETLCSGTTGSAACTSAM
jgi:hypothetical protein